MRKAGHLLIRPEILVEFQKALEERPGEETQQLLYGGGFAGGHLPTDQYRESFGYGDDEIVQFMMNMGGQIGLNAPRAPAFFPQKPMR